MIDMSAISPLESMLTGMNPGTETTDTGMFRYLLGLQFPSGSLETSGEDLLIPTGLPKDKLPKDESIEALAGALAAMGSGLQILPENMADQAQLNADASQLASVVDSDQKPNAKLMEDAPLRRLVNLSAMDTQSGLDGFVATKETSNFGSELSELAQKNSMQGTAQTNQNSADKTAVDGNVAVNQVANQEVQSEPLRHVAKHFAKDADRSVRTKDKSETESVDLLKSLNSDLDPTRSADQSAPRVDGAADPANVMAMAPNEPHAEVLQGIATMAYRGGGRMVVTLEPAELGKLEVQVTARGKKVEVEMFSDSEQAKAVLESSLPQLKESLASQEFELTRADIRHGANPGFDFGGQSLRQSFRDFNDSSSRNPRLESSHSLRTFAAAAAPIRGATAARMNSVEGRLDVRI